ncbi:hypothetical protein ACFQZ4_26470 [Catellatospora coxensis]|uniref:Uncharacterized protein n=2 Tax=Catellatospora coxensis TaxID=310354 RepID=A0A8J3LAS7_9ACTN|nr:hypothetical protein Cco03nite_83310 [Catellatospora coxensis]
MHTQSIATFAVATRPTRLNFAGVCIYCGTRECESARCVTAHDRSVWQVCPDCQGEGFRLGSEDDPCYCAFGLIEIALPVPFVLDAIAPAAPLSPVAPVSGAPISVPPVFLSVPLPRCLGCGHRTASLHEDCVPDINPGSWVPCGCCQGMRIDADGFECQQCCGAGFIPMTGRDTLAERAGEEVPW